MMKMLFPGSVISNPIGLQIRGNFFEFQIIFRIEFNSFLGIESAVLQVHWQCEGLDVGLVKYSLMRPFLIDHHQP